MKLQFVVVGALLGALASAPLFAADAAAPAADAPAATEKMSHAEKHKAKAASNHKKKVAKKKAAAAEAATPTQ